MSGDLARACEEDLRDEMARRMREAIDRSFFEILQIDAIAADPGPLTLEKINRLAYLHDWPRKKPQSLFEQAFSYLQRPFG